MIIEGTEQQLVEKAATIMGKTLQDILTEKEHGVVAIPGGRSVAAIYDRIREYDLDWKRIHFFLLDDRLVPPGHDESNYKLVADHLGDKITESSLHRFNYDETHPESSLARYREELDLYGGKFDIVLASSGEDGHLASLFPSHPVLLETHDGFTLVYDSPKPPPGRMTAGMQLIQSADIGIILFFGEAKREALARFLRDDVPLQDCPARIIATLPRYYVLTDQKIDPGEPAI